ncbi:MAG: NAD(P)/FAD-dependent oxidoreductase [Pseudomonadota bacterium]
MTDFVIIGSGMSSLTSALLLLRKGYSVRILEAHYKPGGYMHSFEKMGHTYDSGAHYVGALADKEPFWALLNYLDTYDSSVFSPLDEEAFDTFHFKDQTVKEVSFGKGYDRVIEHFSGKFPEDVKGIREFFTELKKVARNFPTYEFLVKYDQQALLKALETSLKDVATRHTQNPELLNALYTYCGLHGVMPAEVSFGLHSIIVDSLIRSGGYGFRGSGDALVRQFVSQIEKLGGEIILNEKAVKFEMLNGKVSSVVTRKGKVYEAQKFIFSGHPKDMLDLAGAENFRKPYRHRIMNAPDSVGILGLYGVAQPQSLKKVKTNYYQISGMMPDAQPSHGNFNEKPMISFLTFPDRDVDPSQTEVAYSIHAPQFYSWVESWKQKKGYSRDQDYLKFKSEMADKVFEHMDDFGFELKKKTKSFETSTSLTNRRFNLSPNGSAYGIYHSIQYTGARALSGRTKIENLFITGQNTLFPGIMAASIAGLRTTGFIIGIKDHIAGIRKLMDT